LIRRKKPWASVAIIATDDEHGTQRDMVVVSLETFHGWLFGVNPSKVKPHLREMVIIYQKKVVPILFGTIVADGPYFGNACPLLGTAGSFLRKGGKR
jgi:hypothetical protein